MRQETYLFDKQRKSIKFRDSRPERKIAFFLFLLTALAAGFFWLKGQFANFWQSFTKPSTFEIIFPGQENSKLDNQGHSRLDSKEELIKEIEDLIKDLQGEYAVYVYSFATGNNYGINYQKVFPAASVNKVPIMLAFWQAIEKGRFSPTAEYRLRQDDIQDYGTGRMRYEKEGKIYTYRELLRLSGKKSDNTAAYVLGKILGKKNVEEFIKNLGLEKTSAFGENVTTAEEAGDLFVMVWQGKILKNVKNKEDFLDNLTKTDFEERIPAGIPKGVKVAHKIGSEERAYHDCGLVFGSKPFVLCILSGQAAENEALAVIPKIAGLVWDFEER